MIIAALLTGLLAGVLFSAAEQVLTVPIIIEAETYENSAPVSTETKATTHLDDSHAHGNHAHASTDDTSGFAGFSERTLYTLLASILTGITFSLLLTAAMAFYGKGNARLGLLWGLAGYLAFFVSPSLGLVPELPGTEAAAIEHRQLWWVSTVIATITGLALLVFTKSLVLKGVGTLLLVIPHIVGAPTPEHHGSLAPEALAHAFMWMTAIANFIFWVALGALTGFLLNRFNVISGKMSGKVLS